MLKETLSTVQGKTDSTGKAFFTYLCSGMGGKDSLVARGTGDRDTANAILIIKIQNLEELASSDHYELTESFGEPGVESRHVKNHYGTKNLLEKLKTLADTVYADKKYRIRINDISLANGGPFDIQNDWNTPHEKHREGVSADIDDMVRTATGTLKSITQKQISEWVVKVDGKANLGNEGNHFHLTVKRGTKQ